MTAKNGTSTVVQTEMTYADLSETEATYRVSQWKTTAGGVTKTLTYGYDAHGNIVSISDGTNTSTYVYDEKDQLVQENDPTAGSGGTTWTYSYDAGGNLTGKNEYAYTTAVPATGTPLSVKTYSYGNTVWKDLLTGYDGATLSYDAIGNLTDDGTWSYTWEHGRQLAGQEKSQTVVVNNWFSFDGNPTSDSEGSGEGSQPERGKGDHTDTYTSSVLTYGYDENGIRIRKESEEVENVTDYRLVSVGGGPFAFQTTFSGTRVNTVCDYVYAGGQLTNLTVSRSTYTSTSESGPETLQSQTSDTLHFTYDVLGPATVSHNGTVYYYTRNAQGDITGIVNVSGSEVVSYSYDAWGDPTDVSGSMAATLGALNPFRYRGYVYDEETDLYYVSTRYYNPEICRWISADGYSSTGQGLLGSNMFVYCLNNPVNREDSDGRLASWIIGGLIGGIAGAVSSAIRGGNVLAGIEQGVISGLIAGATVDIALAIIETGGAAGIVFGGLMAYGGGYIGNIAGEEGYSYATTKSFAPIDTGMVERSHVAGVWNVIALGQAQAVASAPMAPKSTIDVTNRGSVYMREVSRNMGDGVARKVDVASSAYSVVLSWFAAKRINSIRGMTK